VKLSLSQTRTKANTCLFCREKLNTPTKCQYCGFKFCADHISTDAHQCGKTRYAEYVRKVNSSAIPNLASGIFSVVCDTCGYRSTKGSLIEFAGEELIQHMQVVGCSENTFLEEEVNTSPQFKPKAETKSGEQKQNATNKNNSEQKGNVVEQLANLVSLREQGVLSDDEFMFIKKEILKNLQ
jgi:hypothetical protein